MRRLLTSLAVLVAVSAPAVACINDSELATHEREFRSSYQRERSAFESMTSGWQFAAPTALYVAGTALLVSAGFVTFRRLSAKG